MTALETWRTQNYTRTDCLSCGKSCTAADTNAAAHRRWARAHALAKPMHQVAVETSTARCYRLSGVAVTEKDQR